MVEVGITRYRLGEWVVNVASRELSRADEVRVLEPKSLAVLEALRRSGGELVSHDALIKAVWQGRIVTDDAIHRQIAKLRGLLDDDAREPRYIQTLSKTGFRLLMPAVPVTEPVSDKGTALPGSRRDARGRAVAMAGAAILVLALAVLAWRAGTPMLPAAPQITRLTSSAGLEIHPALSPSGRQVVYAARTSNDQPWSLHVQELESGQSRQLTTQAGSALYPAWTPDGERIAYLATDGHGGCTVRIISLASGDDRSVRQCVDSVVGGGLAWTADGRSLVFSNRIASGRFQLVRLDTDSGELTPLFDPEADSNGDTTPRISGTGTLAFLRNRAIGIEDVFIARPEAASVPRRLTHDGGEIGGLGWLGEQLIFGSNRHGGMPVLWAIDPRGADPVQLPTPPDAGSPSASADGSALVFSLSAVQVDLWSVPLSGGEGKPLLTSTRADWAPALSPDGQRIAWLSDRSGATEVWVATASGASARQLSRFRGSYTQPPVWTPDGRHLLVSAPAGAVYRLFALNPDAPSPANGAVLSQIEGDASSPAFRPDGSLLHQRVREETSDLVDAEGKVVLTDVRRVRVSPAGVLWFCRPRVPGLWRLEPDGQATQVTRQLARADYRNWEISGEDLWWVRRTDDGEPWLVHRSPDGAVADVRPLPGLHGQSGISIDGNRVIYARTMRRDADLFLMRWPSR